MFARRTPASDQPDYQAWLRGHWPTPRRLRSMRDAAGRFQSPPLLSLVVAVRPSPVEHLQAAIESVRAQAYPVWELSLVHDASIRSDIGQALSRAASGDSRIRLVPADLLEGPAARWNNGLWASRGAFVAFVDDVDELAPHALFEVAQALVRDPGLELVYTDEDVIDASGRHASPAFKPDWCPDSFLSRMYIGNLTFYRRALLAEIGGCRPGLDGGHAYDLALRFTETSSRIGHVPNVLYHARQMGAPEGQAARTVNAQIAEKRALEKAIERRGEPARVDRVPGDAGFYIVRYLIRRSGKVSIIIPSRDQGDMLQCCLDSIFTRSTYPDFEVILVDNGSREARALEVIASWEKREPTRFRALRIDAPFNFSLLCNEAARQARGEFLLFLNNDTEVVTSDWIEAMVEQAQRPSIGAVGALLLYENNTIQHAGAILGLGGLAAHSHRGLPSTSRGYLSQVVTVNNYLSVAASCLMLRAELFAALGGFDERLPGDYEDVDLCLKLVTRGLHNVYLPHVRLYHYESVTRGKDYVTRAPAEREHAMAFIRSRWQHFIDHDPCYNPHLTRAAEDYSLNIAPPPQTWIRRLSVAVRRGFRGLLDAFHHAFPGFPEVKGRGMVAATRGIARRLASFFSPVPRLLSDDSDYRRWLRDHYPGRKALAAMASEASELPWRPLISVILPVHDMEEHYLAKTIESVRAQVYPNWELCIADDGSTANHVRPLLGHFARMDPRIKVVFRKECGGISAASNSALTLARGDFVAQLDHDDLLAPHALFEVAVRLNERPNTDFLYSDEDKIDSWDVHNEPFFKPDWSPNSFLTKMYTCHLGVYRRSLIEQIGGFRPAYDGSEDYDLVLRLVERTSNIEHIPEILYHWRMHPNSTATGSRAVKSWAYDAAVRALQDSLDRRGEPATVSKLPGAIGMYKVRYEIPRTEKVSIIIATEAPAAALDACVLSVLERTTYPDFEIVIVTGGDDVADLAQRFGGWDQEGASRLRFVKAAVALNLSTARNAGARAAVGKFVLFVQDNVQVISPDWLEALIEHAQRPNIGAVGGQILSLDNRVHHAGFILGVCGAVGNAHRGAPAGALNYFGRLGTLSDVSAVSGACLMCRREVFERLGGFDEAFDREFGDVDLCLRMRESGLQNVYLPQVRLYQHADVGNNQASRETATDGPSPADRLRVLWSRYMENDPCYSPHLSRTRTDFSIRTGDTDQNQIRRRN